MQFSSRRSYGNNKAIIIPLSPEQTNPILIISSLVMSTNEAPTTVYKPNEQHCIHTHQHSNNQIQALFLLPSFFSFNCCCALIAFIRIVHVLSLAFCSCWCWLWSVMSTALAEFSARMYAYMESSTICDCCSAYESCWGG